jgi:mRNA interferase RelE/StbE
VTYSLVYHPQVADDVRAIDRKDRTRLSKAIHERLTTNPEQFGKPLRGTLAGYWKLRVGDYRVVFRIVGKEVWVFGMIHRRSIYDDILRRLS